MTQVSTIALFWFRNINVAKRRKYRHSNSLYVDKFCINIRALLLKGIFMVDNLIILNIISFFVACITIFIFLIKLIRRTPKKRCGIVFLLSFILFWVSGLSCGAISSQNNNAAEKNEETSQGNDQTDENATKYNEEELEKRLAEFKEHDFIRKLTSFGFRYEEAEANAEILRKCGIPSLDDCEPVSKGSIDDLLAFRGKLGKNQVFVFTVEHRKILYVSVNGTDLYDQAKGGYLKKYSDARVAQSQVPRDIANTLRSQTESVLDAYLGTSRYYDAWGFSRDNNNYMVQCQATDGSIFTHNFILCRVWYKQKSKDDFIVTGVQIGGRKYKVK